MRKAKSKTKVRDESENLAEKLNQVAAQSEADGKSLAERQTTDETVAVKAAMEKAENDTTYDPVFEAWDEREFSPQDFMIDVPIDSLESAVGYSSLFRQMHQSFNRTVAFHKSPSGGSLSTEEARARAFHACDNVEEAKSSSE